MDRTIFHIDVNSAFLSWSAVKRLREDPTAIDLRTIPSAVGGDVKTRHGIITARSIPAKRYGIRTAMPVVQAHDDPSPPAVKTVNSRQYSIPHISMCHKLFFRTFVAVQDRLTLWRRRGIVPVLSAATG